jgi:hypothetical protein
MQNSDMTNARQWPATNQTTRSRADLLQMLEVRKQIQPRTAIKKLNPILAASIIVMAGALTALAQPLLPMFYQGNLWDRNVNEGAAFPTVAGSITTFLASDTQWLQVRTHRAFVGSVRATFEINPHLNSGGVNEDQAIIGFGQDWFYYHENPVGQWVPGPGPDSLGVMFQGGTIYVVDGYGSDHHQLFPIGTYVAGRWLEITMDLSADGRLKVTGPNINVVYQATHLAAARRFIIANSNSTDGFQIRKVRVRESKEHAFAQSPAVKETRKFSKEPCKTELKLSVVPLECKSF